MKHIIKGWWFVMDASKVFASYLINRYNIFGVNNSMLQEDTNNDGREANDEYDIEVCLFHFQLLYLLY